MDERSINRLRRWTEPCSAIGIDRDSARRQGDLLVLAHSEMHRRYHDLTHLDECFAVVDAMPDLTQQDRHIVDLAIWFHDAIYDPTRSDNEVLSASMARNFLESAEVSCGDEVGDLIEMTAGHMPRDVTPRSAAMHDADLAILGAEESRYHEYAGQIRAEYAHVPDAEFTVGRGRVLGSFLALEQVYLRPDMRRRLEPQARENMRTELDALRLDPG